MAHVNPIKALWKILGEQYGYENLDEDSFGKALLFSEQEAEVIMPAYCLNCGRALTEVAKNGVIVPTCNSCNKEFYDASLGWRQQDGGIPMGAVVEVQVKVVKAEPEAEPESESKDE